MEVLSVFWRQLFANILSISFEQKKQSMEDHVESDDWQRKGEDLAIALFLACGY